VAQGLSFGVRLLEGFPASWSGSLRKPKAKGYILSNSGRRAVKSIDFQVQSTMRIGESFFGQEKAIGIL